MERAQIEKAIALVELFRLEHGEMPLMQQRIFLECCRNEGESISTVQKKAGQSEAAGSRNIRALTDRLGPNKKGYGLVALVADQMDIRRKNITLTPKGKELAKKISEVLAN